MPRPPAKRGRVARHKAGHGQKRTSHTGNDNGPADTGGLAVEIQKGDVFGSGALGWTDSKQRARDASSSSITKAGNITTGTTATSFANSSKRVTKTHNHETPRRASRTSRENNGSSGPPPATAQRPGTRGHQPLGSAIRRGDASSKIQRMATPGFDSSMLSSFRRRPRQPSILHLMNDDDEGEERGSSDLDSEAFLGEFDPDDESTPLNFSKRTTLPVDALPPTPSPRKNAAALMPPPSRAKKRKLRAVEIPASSRGDAEDGDDAADNYLSENSETNSIALPELPERNTSAEASARTSQTIMAPPVSSSVVGSPAKEHPLQDKPSRRPPLQPRTTTNTEAHVSTAVLRENLLPVRRRRRAVGRHPIGADVFDVVSDEDDDARGAADEDELSRHPSRSKRGTSGRKALRSNKHGINKKVVDRNAPRSHRRAHSKHHRGKVQQGNEKQPSATTTGKKKQLSRPARDHITYSRRSLQDKENETYAAPGSSSSDTDHDAQDSATPNAQRQPYRRLVSAELIEQAKKFAEVDRWPLEFEDVMWEPSSSFL